MRRPAACGRAASSITQQLAKNLFLSKATHRAQGERGVSGDRLETRLSKKRDSENSYLDRAYMGGGTFGVDGAAHFYFNKSAARRQSRGSRDAGRPVQAPTKYAAAHQPARRPRPRQCWCSTICRCRFLTEGQVFGARRNPARRSIAAKREFAELLSRLGVDEMRKLVDTFPRSYVEASCGPHRDRYERAARRRGRHRKPCASSAPRTITRPRPPPWSPISTAACRPPMSAGNATMAPPSPVQPRRGCLRASPVRRFKPYVYSTALLNGFQADSIVVDGPVCIGNWCPQNYGHSYSGAVTLTQAITRSINRRSGQAVDAIGGKGGPEKAGAPRSWRWRPLRHQGAAAGHALAADRRR